MKKIRTICVIGSGDNNLTANSVLATLARDVGNVIARAGFNIVTGGGKGVMQYAAEGFVLTPERKGKSIGILPGTLPNHAFEPLNKITHYELQLKDGYPNQWIEIEIRTHLPGSDPKGKDSRNFINIQSSDVVVALPGGKGTQAELEIAISQRKKVFIFLLNEQKIGTYSKNALLQLPNVTFIHDIEELRQQVSVE